MDRRVKSWSRELMCKRPIPAVCNEEWVVEDDGLAGSPRKAGNFVEAMLRLGHGQVRVVSDLRMAEASTRNLAGQVLALIRTEHYGT
jgi:dTDP-4-dehydrorhamnose reductase